jgi:hypothetical protein
MKMPIAWCDILGAVKIWIFPGKHFCEKCNSGWICWKCYILVAVEWTVLVRPVGPCASTEPNLTHFVVIGEFLFVLLVLGSFHTFGGVECRCCGCFVLFRVYWHFCLSPTSAVDGIPFVVW